MSILNKLTVKNLFLNKKRSIATIIGIMLSTAMMVGIGLLFSSFWDWMIRDTIDYSGKYEANYSDVSLVSLNNIKDKDFTYFYEKPIGFSKIDSSNEYKPYMYITSVNEEYFDELKLVEGSFPKNDREVVISNHVISNGGVNYRIGDEVTFSYGSRNIDGTSIMINSDYIDGEVISDIGVNTYTVVGIVERSSYENYSACGYTAFTLDMNNSDGNVNLYVIFNSKKNIVNKSELLGKELGYDGDINYNSTLLGLYGESSYSNVVDTIVSMLVIMLSLVSVGCIIVIYNSFAISVMERKREFGLQSSIGATKWQIRGSVFYEALLVGIVGIILGIISAYIGIGCTIVIINNLIGDMFIYKLHLVTKFLFIVIPVIFMFFVIFISSFIPSIRASRISPIEAIRMNDDIRINKRKIKTCKFILKLFGIEGEIALKNIKRNKKKYRVTVVSLFISIVLFISFSSYMNYTLNTASNLIGKISYDYQISFYISFDDSDDIVLDKINSIISNSDVIEYASYSGSSYSMVSNYIYSDKYLDYYSNMYGEDVSDKFSNLTIHSISVLVIDDNSYNRYKKLVGIDNDRVILLNRFKGVGYGNGKRINYDVSVINNNSSIKICDNSDDISYCNRVIDNVIVTDKSLDLFDEFCYLGDYKLIVNKKLYDSLFGNPLDYTQFNIVSDNTDSIDKLTCELDKYSNVSYINVNDSMKQANNIILAAKILLYGFIVLVTLIGITSVFNTISTSMALRKREFAVLRSIGLTNKGFNKILFFESLFFGMKSLIFGIFVSIGITFLIHYSLSDMMSISGIIIPWKAIFISIISVFLIVLITMMYSASKIKKNNIIEQIREENI